MTLFDIARGPALQVSLFIFVLGVVWRLVGTSLILRPKDLSVPRETGEFWGGLRTIISRSFLPHTFEKLIVTPYALAYTLHIGLFIVVLLFVPHILFFESILGFSWPGLPNDVILVAGGITLASLVALLVRRLTHPVLKVVSSADDYITWCVTTLPLVTGLMAFAHLGPRYETMLAIHILSVEVLLIWFPFGKLMHTFFIFPSRYNVGATFGRRGVKA